VVIIGGGIVGLATARALQLRSPGMDVLVLDKEPSLAAHQSSHNSGVIHAGVYYRPGSAKADLCRRGREQLLDYCRDHGISYDICGKLVVATSDAELPALAAIERRCADSHVITERLDPGHMREVEPHVAGVAALHVGASGVVSFPAVCQQLRQDIRDRSGEVRLGVRFEQGGASGNGVDLETTAGVIRARAVINSGGLQADRIARGLGAQPDTTILPFRGEYYQLTSDAAHLVNALIYPVPDPRLPFLGVHATRGIDGAVLLGPNAVLAGAREGYGWRTFDRRDIRDMVGYPGTWRLIPQFWRAGLGEIARSLSTKAFTRALQRLIPEVSLVDVVAGEAGVRAQAVDRKGQLIDDFVFEHNHPRVLHVLNAPSPAATASLAIGEAIAVRLLASWDTV
jgi:L-2-hydroxyglutarate oxidase